MNYFVTAIDTDSGKTLVSAILCEALQADYWKPVQAGLPRDADVVRNLIDPALTIHPEAYLLRTAASPHASAKLDQLEISINKITIPETERDLVIEGAGGCLVPLNDREFVIDIISAFDAQVILVADLYLGSINHTLLTIEALRHRGLSIKGIVFNGASNAESERIILLHSKLNCILRIKREDSVDKNTIRKYAKILNQHWND